jgi:hypothetical protein
MYWRGPLASALVGLSLAAAGCECEETFVDLCVGRNDFGLLRAIEAAGRGEGDDADVRAQAPDREKTTTVAYLAPPDSTGVQTAGYSAVRVAATVNGEAILNEEVMAMTQDIIRQLSTMPEPERGRRIAEVYNQALNDLIEREVVVQDAFERLKKGGPQNLNKLTELATKDFENNWLRPIKAQYKIKTDEEFRAFLKAQGVSLELAKRGWERRFMMHAYLNNRVFQIVDQLGHVQLVEYYEKHPDEFKVEDRVDWQDVFISASKHASRDAAKRFAEVIAQQLRQGEDFAKLSDKFDDGDAKLRKGEGQGHKRGEISPPELEPELMKLKDNDVVVFEQPFGFHVIRLAKRQYAGLMPFDEKTQKLIKDKLRNEIMQRESKRIVTELKRQAVIEVFK